AGPGPVDGVGRYLEALGPEAIDEFVGVLADEPDAATRDRMGEVLAALGKAAAPAVRSRVTDRRWPVARSMVALLGRLGDVDGLPAVEKAVAHEHPHVRSEAVRVLPALAPRQAARWLIMCLEDADADVRRAALTSLRTVAEAGSVGPIGAHLVTPTRT